MVFRTLALKFLLGLALVVCAQSVMGQTTQDSIKQTVDRMFLGMKNADSALVVGVFHPSAVLQTIVGDGSIRTQGYTEMGAVIKKLKAGQLDERITYGSIQVDGNLASVWTPYRLYFDGNFMHCGANSFQLVRTNGAWKIVHLIDTRRKDCDKQ
ncbi:MAG: nuclear transport factor 2 family protein [Sphingobacteriales bacterium]